MADCDCLPGCPFFNDRLKGMEGSATLFKKRYCLADYTSCARHQVVVALGKDAVPPDLFPNRNERAQLIIAGGR